MIEEAANDLLNKVGEMVTAAASRLSFRAGNSTTKVTPGFPFTVVNSSSQRQFAEPPKVVAPDYSVGYFSEAGINGSNVFVTPLDPSTHIGGNSCYSTPLPYLFIPAGQTRLLYLKQTFALEAWQDCLIIPQDPPPDLHIARGPVHKIISTQPPEVVLFSSVPTSDFPTPEKNACDQPVGPPSGGFYWPGSYTYYYLLARLEGQEGLPVRDLRIWSSSDPVSTAIKTADFERNYGARVSMFFGASFMPAIFPIWAFVFGGGVIFDSGDVSGNSGYGALGVPPLPPS